MAIILESTIQDNIFWYDVLVILAALKWVHNRICPIPVHVAIYTDNLNTVQMFDSLSAALLWQTPSIRLYFPHFFQHRPQGVVYCRRAQHSYLAASSMLHNNMSPIFAYPPSYPLEQRLGMHHNAELEQLIQTTPKGSLDVQSPCTQMHNSAWLDWLILLISSPTSCSARYMVSLLTPPLKHYPFTLYSCATTSSWIPSSYNFSRCHGIVKQPGTLYSDYCKPYLFMFVSL